ncbi:MAG: CinA family protein [Hyphomicrobiaceae bacterium]
MFSDDMKRQGAAFLEAMRLKGLRFASAESCTGGLIAALLTEIPGSSDVVDRGFVTYSNEAKNEMIGVKVELLTEFGAVSREVALAMAEGALEHSAADVSVAVTGVAGPGGGTATKPVGLVHIAAARTGAMTLHQECRFGPLDRAEIRAKTVVEALSLATRALELQTK